MTGRNNVIGIVVGLRLGAKTDRRPDGEGERLLVLFILCFAG
jgi:hypothetical protein